MSSNARSASAALRKGTSIRPRRTAADRLLATSRRQRARAHHFPRHSQIFGAPHRWSPRRRSTRVPRSCRAPGSRPAVVTVGFPLSPLEGTELQLLRALPDAPYGGPRLVAVEGLRWRHQARHRFAVSRNDDLLTALDQVEQLAELVLRLEGADLSHCFCLSQSASLI